MGSGTAALLLALLSGGAAAAGACVRPCVRASVRPSVRPSVSPSVRPPLSVHPSSYMPGVCLRVLDAEYFGGGPIPAGNRALKKFNSIKRRNRLKSEGEHPMVHQLTDENNALSAENQKLRPEQRSTSPHLLLHVCCVYVALKLSVHCMDVESDPKA